MDKKLRIGVLLNKLDIKSLKNWELRLFDDIVNNDQFELVAIIKDGRKKISKLGFVLKLIKEGRLIRSLTFVVLAFIDTLLFTKKNRHTATDFEKAIKHLIIVDVFPKKIGFVDLFTLEDTQKIESLNLDVILRHGFSIIKGGILTASNYGVWSFHYADNRKHRGGPPGFWEVYNHEDVIAVTLHVLSEDGGDPRFGHLVRYNRPVKKKTTSLIFEDERDNRKSRRIFAGYTPNKEPFVDESNKEMVISRAFYDTKFSFSLTCQHISNMSVKVLLKELAKLHDNGEIEYLPPTMFFNTILKCPSTFQQIKYLLSLSLRVFDKIVLRFEKMIGKDPLKWSLFIGRAHENKFSLSKVTETFPPKGEFWADPFMIKKEGDVYVYFENWDYNNKKGKISCGKVIDDKIIYQGDALDLEYHLSYPFVFEHENEIYMMPETQKKRRVEVWKSVNFPLEWELHATALEGVLAVDPTFYYDGSHWWLFVNIGGDRFGDQFSELYVYQVDSPSLKSVISHKQNPIVMDARVGRNGGRVFERDGKIYRTSQRNVRGIYGYGFNLMEIKKLTLDDYSETLAYAAMPGFKEGVIGTHHMDALDDVFVVDGCRRR